MNIDRVMARLAELKAIAPKGAEVKVRTSDKGNIKVYYTPQYGPTVVLGWILV